MFYYFSLFLLFLGWAPKTQTKHSLWPTVSENKVASQTTIDHSASTRWTPLTMASCFNQQMTHEFTICYQMFKENNKVCLIKQKQMAFTTHRAAKQAICHKTLTNKWEIQWLMLTLWIKWGLVMLEVIKDMHLIHSNTISAKLCKVKEKATTSETAAASARVPPTDLLSISI